MVKVASLFNRLLPHFPSNRIRRTGQQAQRRARRQGLHLLDPVRLDAVLSARARLHRPRAVAATIRRRPQPSTPERG